MIDKIRKGEYIPKCEYPPKPSKKFLCSCSTPLTREYKYCTNCGKYVEKDIKNEYDEYTRKRDIYRKVENQLYSDFKNDLLKEFDLTDHPKSNEIFEYVWDRGHANGYMEVYNVLENMHHLFTNV